MGRPIPADLRAALHRPKPDEWQIACPVDHCQAKPGTPCRTPKRRSVPGGSHPSRLDAWLVRQHHAA